MPDCAAQFGIGQRSCRLAPGFRGGDFSFVEIQFGIRFQRLTHERIERDRIGGRVHRLIGCRTTCRAPEHGNKK